MDGASADGRGSDAVEMFRVSGSTRKPEVRGVRTSRYVSRSLEGTESREKRREGQP